MIIDELDSRSTSKSIFQRWSRAFFLASDEDLRWRREGPFLLSLMRHYVPPNTRIIDFACGHGLHARRLAAEGFDVSAIDASCDTIRRAKTLPGGDRVRWVCRDILKSFDERFDVALLLGNTLSLLENEKAREAFRSIGDSLVESGMFILHIIDFDYLKDHPVRFSRGGVINGENTRFEKSIHAADGGAVISIDVTRNTPRGVKHEHGDQTLHEHGIPAIESWASENGLKKASVYSDFSEDTPYRSGESKDILVVFRKM